MKDEIWSDLGAQWCQDLMNSPDLIRQEMPGRRPPPPLDRFVTNTLMSATLSTDETIRAWVALKGKEDKPQCASPEYIILLSLGTGLDGYDNVAHGGIAPLLMDQVMAMCVITKFGPSAVTSESWQRFKRAIKLPSVVLCRAVATRRDSHQIWVESTVEDGRGVVYCEGGGVFKLRRKSANSNKM